MPKYVIERNIAGAGRLSPMELKGASQKSNEVLCAMGPKIQWQQTYVTDDKLYCVYIADSEREVREHAARSGFPASNIATVRALIDPSTAE